MIEITRFEKVGGPLTKRISLSPDGTLKSDGSACLMARGSAQRIPECVRRSEQELREFAVARGYNPGWVWHQLQDWRAADLRRTAEGGAQS